MAYIYLDEHEVKARWAMKDSMVIKELEVFFGSKESSFYIKKNFEREARCLSSIPTSLFVLLFVRFGLTWSVPGKKFIGMYLMLKWFGVHYRKVVSGTLWLLQAHLWQGPYCGKWSRKWISAHLCYRASLRYRALMTTTLEACTTGCIRGGPAMIDVQAESWWACSLTSKWWGIERWPDYPGWLTCVWYGLEVQRHTGPTNPNILVASYFQAQVAILLGPWTKEVDSRPNQQGT